MFNITEITFSSSFWCSIWAWAGGLDHVYKPKFIESLPSAKWLIFALTYSRTGGADKVVSECIFISKDGILHFGSWKEKKKKPLEKHWSHCSATETNTFFKVLAAPLKAKQCISGHFSNCQSVSERSGQCHVKQNSALMQCTRSWLCQCDIYHLWSRRN